MLTAAITRLQQQAQGTASAADARRTRNVVDPFFSLLIAATLDVKDAEALAATQRAEAAVRGMSNALGEFHQQVLGSVDGWVNHDAGYDLECESRHILAEVKNKWNTMNDANRRQVVTGLAEARRQKREAWDAYLVLIIPRRPQRYTTAIPGHRNVYEIDGASFYHLVTGEANALHDLFEHLCDELAPSDSIRQYCHAVVERSLPPRLQ